MTRNTLSRSSVAGAALVFALAGCSSVNLDDQAAAPIVDATASTGTKSGTDPRAVASVDAQAGRGLDPLNDPNNPLSKRSVFFDFDSFVVKSEYQPIVQTHGSYLGTNKQRRVTVEGHTDERGGREYNLALGQKRAEAVKQRLLLLGVAETQVETVSFGEEKPRGTGASEDAWAQNRRADLNYR
ncbi:MAG: peptidoglycan-associated lipoprotein Pal [Burkholderiaceae bacterium]|nr:peptidoglycan-associated lipoprotein Pal [Burkholderiaceae bacterium]